MVTLTYNPEFVPSYEIVDGKNYWTVDKYDMMKRHVFEYNRFDIPYDEVELRPAFARFYPKKGFRTDEFVLRDADSLHYPSIRVKGVSSAMVDAYFKHRKLYELKYCQTNFKVNKGYIDLCPVADLQIFIQQFKNFALRKCNGAKFKYFAVSDYGTNGLAPHWHIMFFFDSYDLYRAFEDCSNYGICKKPSYSAKFIYKLWRYGITNTSRVRKSCASYVSSYLNSVSLFPQLLRICAKQRSYHSPLLGQVLPSEVVKKNLLGRNFGFFFNLKGYNSKGEQFTYRWRSQIFDNVLPRLPYVDKTNVRGNCIVYGKVKAFLDSVTSLSDDDMLSKLSLSDCAFNFYDYCRSSSDVTLQDYVRLQDYRSMFTNTNINLFYTLILRVNSISIRCRDWGISTLQYFELLRDCHQYRSQYLLSQLFRSLENSSQLAKSYYMQVHTNFAFNDLNVDYQNFLSDLLPKLHNNIKHKEQAERYRLILM